ncbi:MAG TPA: hypothetical protein VMB53_00605 [Gaiellaceae bacterium]|nr:hypothetical protein [Gaiellaceae bacterium]
MLATWLFIVPMLALFSFSVVAGAHTFQKPDYASAVKQLPADQPVVQVDVSKGSAPSSPGLLPDFSQQHFVCSVTQSELARIQQRWRTGRLSIGRLDIVTVFGANDQELRSYLGDNGVRCVLVRVASIFFLPFDPHGS